ncbi:hypothetical protein DAEQUDRAFT_2535 [Daedalea quercina L-15889]|uniref:BTB domain-containing protein n=1 Tax=Daedalea quercina L-15889 TaxID=1314783 RepID=A0A165UBS7_9APHY|nr:hypothetical protein DAEQUDRAFT_2535 [Daedalea quercina L-15889]
MSYPKFHPSFQPGSDTDIVLCSRDGISFCVFSQSLKLASGWFNRLLTEPKDVPRSSPNEPIRIPEEASVVAGLLKTTFSMEMPPVDAADLVINVLRAAEYYEMPTAIMLIRACLTSDVSRVSPIGVYVIACERSWEREVEWALSRTIRMDLCSPEVAKELVRLDGSAIMKLFVLQRRRRDALREKLDDSGVFDKGNEVLQTCPRCSRNFGDNPWLALKTWWLSRAERVPISVDDVDSDMVQVTAEATCPHCRETLYDATHTKTNLRAMIKALPTTLEVND